MKYLIVSDIHGKNEYIKLLFEIVENEQPNKIILLGDIMSYSDNNLLIDFINTYKDKLVLIKGNCDYPDLIDEDMLDYYKEIINGHIFLFTHGHLLDYIPKDDSEMIVSGHTHQNLLVKQSDGIILFNPGSISLPRGNTVNSYGIITDEDITIYDTNNQKIKSLKYIN